MWVQSELRLKYYKLIVELDIFLFDTMFHPFAWGLRVFDTQNL